MHSVSHRAGDGKCIAKDNKRAAMRRVVGLRSRVDDDGPSGHTAGSLGLPVGIRVAIAAQEFVVHEATQQGLDKVVLKGIDAAVERIVHLAVVELRVQRLAWSHSRPAPGTHWRRESRRVRNL